MIKSARRRLSFAGRRFPTPLEPLESRTLFAAVADAAYPLLLDRTRLSGSGFFVYQDADSGLNHGFPSGFFGPALHKIRLDAAAVNDPAAADGTSDDPNRLDRTRGTVMRVSFDPLSP